MVVEVVRADDRHCEALAVFYRAVWDRAATAQRVQEARRAAAAANPIHPGEPPPTFLFLQGGTVLGHLTTIPVRLSVGGQERPGHWLKGLMVLPEHRNGPVGMMVLKEAVRQLDLQLAMVVAEAPRRLYRALGFRDLGPLPNRLRLLRPGRVLRHVDPAALPAGRTAILRHAMGAAQRSGIATMAGGAVGALTALWERAAGAVPATLSSRPLAGADRAAVDRLWRELAPGFGAAPARDAQAWWARYDAPDGPYRMLAVQRATELVGVAAVRAPRTDGDPRLRGVRVATLADALFDPRAPEIALAVLAAGERAARDLDADALLCSASDARVAGPLRRRAFMPFPGTVHCVLRDPAADARSYPDLRAWWLWRGDSSADEVF